jgi:hypothetical protein
MSKFIDGLVSIDLRLAIRAVALEIAVSADNYAAEVGDGYAGERALAAAARKLAEHGIENPVLRTPGSDEVRLIIDAAYAIDEALSFVERAESDDERSAKYCIEMAWNRLVRFEHNILTPEEIEGRIRDRLRKALRAA